MKKVLIVVTIAAICGGSVPPFAKIAEEVFQPFTLVLIRFFFASLFLLPFVFRSKELNVKSFGELFWVAIIGSLNPILLFIALEFTKASVSPLIYAAIPAMTALYLYFFKKQKITLNQQIGIIIGFVGVAFIILLPIIEKGNLRLHEFTGNILIFFAAIAFLTYGLISKNKQEKYHISPMALTFYFSIVSFLVAIPFAGYELIRNNSMLWHIQLKHILAALEVGIVGTSIFYLAYQYSLKLSSELTAGLFTYLQPVSTIAFASLLLGEKLTIPFFVGGIMAVVGAHIASGQKALQRLLGKILAEE